MSNKHKLTMALAAVLAVAPQFITVLPPAYKDVASAFIAFLGALYHLYQPAPEVK